MFRANHRNHVSKSVRLASAAVFDRLESRVLYSSTYEVINGLDENAGGQAYAGSLRDVINQANADPGSTIAFDQLAGATVTLNHDLPPITTDNTVIDGTTGAGGRVRIVGSSHSALDVKANNVKIRNVEVVDCHNAIAVESGSTGTVVTSSTIGGQNGDQNSYAIILQGGSTTSTIGGATADLRNIISGNSYGLYLTGATSSNVIEGNYIGLDSTGESAVYNGTGVHLGNGALNNTVTGNVISGNQYGIYADQDGGNNTFSQNVIGLDAGGTLLVADTSGGVYLDSGSISTTSPAPGDLLQQNTIAAKYSSAVYVGGDNNSIIRNTITQSIYSALSISGSHNTVSTNTLTGNGYGISVSSSYANRNTFSQNAIYNNTNLGIDLGLTGNSATGGTLANGANGQQPYPVLTVADEGGDILSVTATLTSNPGTDYTIELFANTPANVDASGFGEGQTYVSSMTLTTDETGSGTATTQISKSLYDADYLSATATNSSAFDAAANPDAGSTSQFAASVAAPGVVLPTVSITGGAARQGDSIAFVATLSSASPGAVKAQYVLTPGTATTADFSSRGGTLTFPSGTTQETIYVYTYGASTGSDETFTLTLQNLSTNALFSNSQSTESATGTIIANSSSLQTASIAVGSSSSQISLGASVILTATVTGGLGTPTGIVTFLANGTEIGTATSLDGTGTASVTVSTLSSGSNDITASYSGDATYTSSSTSSGVVVHVGGNNVQGSAGTRVNLVASAGTLLVGQTCSLTATVFASSGSGSTPTGSVTLYQDGDNKGTYPLESNGQAVIPVTAAAAASYTDIYVTYGGDANYSRSTSATISQKYLTPSPVTGSIHKPVVPASAVAGQKFVAKVPLVFTNTGAAQSGYYTVVLYADTTSAGLDNPTPLASVTRRATLKTGKSLSISLAVKSLPGSLPTGNYYLVAEVTDPNGNINLVTTPGSVSLQAADPSLAVSLSPVIPSYVKAGRSGKITITLTSSGNVTASGYVAISLGVSNDNGATILPALLASALRRISLKPGKSTRIALRFNANLPSSSYQPVVGVTFNNATSTTTGSSFLVG